MADLSRLRGDIAQILNPMVREGLISSFRTNLTPGGEGPWSEPEVIITSRSGDFIAVQQMVGRSVEATKSGVQVTVQREPETNNGR